MVVYIGVFVFAGRWLDNRYATEKPWWTLGLSLTGVVFSMVYLVRRFLRDSNSNKDED